MRTENVIEINSMYQTLSGLVVKKQTMITFLQKSFMITKVTNVATFLSKDIKENFPCTLLQAMVKIFK